MSMSPINYSLIFREPTKLQGALINGLESRVSQIEQKLSDLDARGSEEHDNLANERELHRFIMTGDWLLSLYCHYQEIVCKEHVNFF